MGAHPNISATRFPRQSDDVGRRVLVCYHYDTSVRQPGQIVRDDVEAPYCTIIAIDDGPVVLATECQYSFVTERGE